MLEGMENAKLNYRNSKLFSHAFLEEHLPNLPEWQILEDELERAREKLQDLFQRALPATSEAALEEELIRPILGEVLEFSYLVQPSAAVFKTHRQPDYALFAGEEEKQGAKAFDGDKRLFESALAVADAKAWDVSLDAVGPASQMHDYVLISGVHWGILTNGRRWRLTHRDTVHELDTFFEIDLEELLKADDPALLKYFLVFFRAESFRPGGFLDHVLTQSVEYAQRVGAELKENVYEALRCLCQGFLGGNAELSPEGLSAIHQNALIVLYRILFLLYAESERERELLPLSNTDYRERIGLCALKRRVSEQSDWLEEKHALWTDLCDLCRLINQGSEPLGIYAYNGGLFDPQLHPLLERRQIGDSFLAEALRLLACTEVEGRRGFLDYSALDVRELGSIYEGLLEHKLIQKNGALDWEKDRSQRKKTGSYYTPEYIVQYIVEQTIGPLIDEIQSGLKTDLDELTEKIRRARGENRKLLTEKKQELLRDARERVLDLKVLDPAMGSGHFLVSACDYVARRIAELEADLAGKETEEAVQALKRTVAERCLYGVDLNPLATELAKLSLWLHTVAKGKPLSFLDHHLRTGNSLIGARVVDLERPPSGKAHDIGLWESKLVQDLAKAIGYLNFIKASASASRSDIEEKKQRWELVNAWIGKYKQAADVWLSSHFGNSVSDDVFRQILEAAASGTIDGISDAPVFRQAQNIAAEKRFFHWELEFPDVFFDKHGRRLANPGFDAVIGNPPWGATLPRPDKVWLNEVLSGIAGNNDTFAAFIEMNLGILRFQGILGLIVPNAWLTGVSYKPLREVVYSESLPRSLVNLPYDVFEAAYIDSAIVTTRKGSLESGFLYQGPLRALTYSKREGVSEIDLEDERWVSIDPQRWASDPELRFDIYRNDQEVQLWQRIEEKSVQLQLIAETARGLEAYSRLTQAKEIVEQQAYHSRTALGPDWFPQFRGFLGRYVLEWESPVYVKLGSHLAECPDIRFFKSRRILLRRLISRQFRLMSVLTKEEFANDSSTFNILLSDVNWSPAYVLAILNSSVFSYFVLRRSVIAQRDDYPKLSLKEIRSLPIRRITFVTPKDERARLVEEGKRLYFEALAKLGLEADNLSTSNTPPTKSKSAGGGVG